MLDCSSSTDELTAYDTAADTPWRNAKANPAARASHGPRYVYMETSLAITALGLR